MRSLLAPLRVRAGCVRGYGECTISYAYIQYKCIPNACRMASGATAGDLEEEPPMMRAKRFVRAALAAIVALTGGGPAIAQQTVRIGVVAEFSGPFADYGAQIVGG